MTAARNGRPLTRWMRKSSLPFTPTSGAKGLGPALGPDGAGRLADALRDAGYGVATARSDWRLSAPEDAALIASLAVGTAHAVAPVLGERAAEWRRNRAAATSVMVGHLDLLALPPGA